MELFWNLNLPPCSAERFFFTFSANFTNPVLMFAVCGYAQARCMEWMIELFRFSFFHRYCRSPFDRCILLLQFHTISFKSQLLSFFCSRTSIVTLQNLKLQPSTCLLSKNATLTPVNLSYPPWHTGFPWSYLTVFLIWCGRCGAALRWGTPSFHLSIKAVAAIKKTIAKQLVVGVCDPYPKFLNT